MSSIGHLDSTNQEADWSERRRTKQFAVGSSGIHANRPCTFDRKRLLMTINSHREIFQ